MLKELIQSEIGSIMGGRGCNCCCKRNPYVIHYEGIRVGLVDSESICLSLCNTRKDSLGYMSCQDEKKTAFDCSLLNNTEVADDIDCLRTSFPKLFWGVDTKKMREI